MNKKKSWVWIPAIIALFAIGGGVYAYTQGLLPGQVNAAAATPTANEVETATAKMGNLTISASGSGTLVAAREMDLGFSAAAKVDAIYVTIGDQVKTGDVLAIADNISELEAIVKTRELDLLLADEVLQNLYDNADIAIAEAKLALAEANDVYDDAYLTDYYTSGKRCDDTTIELYQVYYEEAVEKRIDAEDDNDGSTRALESLLSAQDNEQSTLANLNYCLGMTNANDVLAAQADLSIASINVQKAQAALDDLITNNGVDPEERLQAETDVANAELALTSAQNDLDNATLLAPFDGVVMNLDAYEGQNVGTSTFITIASMNPITLDVYFDEADMDLVVSGYPVEIEFDAIPDRIFNGTMTVVYPGLVSSGNVNVVQGEAIIHQTTLTGDQKLVTGMGATVEVIGGDAKNAILIPVEALRDLGDETYAVFVMENGEPRLRVVEVGLMDYYYAEIISGIDAGEVVTTGMVEVE